MSLKTFLFDSVSGARLEILTDIFGHPNLAVTDHYAMDTRFKTTTRTTAGTTEIVAPTKDGSIVLTDMIISTDRVASSELLLFFGDDTRQITIYDGYANDAPINLAVGLHGAWTGWKDASLKMTTVTTIKATVAVGYIKIHTGLEYREWNALR